MYPSGPVLDTLPQPRYLHPLPSPRPGSLVSEPEPVPVQAPNRTWSYPAGYLFPSGLVLCGPVLSSAAALFAVTTERHLLHSTSRPRGKIVCWGCPCCRAVAAPLCLLFFFSCLVFFLVSLARPPQPGLPLPPPSIAVAILASQALSILDRSVKQHNTCEVARKQFLIG
ncbi:hypothetical protein F5Y10DRAFT_60809 [Nemania abortiva]|nr:hypothetical protein F5Y10DRAFT_60809 [Nemania abortiva]